VNVKILVYAIICGVVITLLTGLIETTGNMEVACCGLLTWYGFPLAWLYSVEIVPHYYLWEFDTLKLIFNLIFWTAIIGTALFLTTLTKVRKNG